MGFGHIYVRGGQARVLEAMDRYLAEKGFDRVEMTPADHPARMKEFHENERRLYWVSPELNGWTGIFEFRYYSNEVRERWGYSDEHLAVRLSGDLGVPVYRLEVMDTTGFWMYCRYEAGEEKDYKVHEEDPGPPSPDPAHPRYELNRLVDRERLANAGLGYENVPGPQVASVQGSAWWPPEKIEGHAGFVHRAYTRRSS